MLHELSRTLLSWLVILPSAYLAGSLYERFFRRWDGVIRGILCYAFGLATLSYGVVLLSALGILKPGYVWGMLFCPIVFGAGKWRDVWHWWREIWRGLFPQTDFFSKILFVFFAISLAALLMGTFSPELGGDALCYQLNLPKIFLRAGSLTPDPLDYNSYFPLLMNNLYLIGLATGGVFAAKAAHFFCSFLLFLAVKRFLEIETHNRNLAYFMALVVWTTPTVFNLASTTYIDVGLGFYTFMAVMIFTEALVTEEKSDFFVSGLLAGCGMAIKYLCAISVVGLAAIACYRLISRRRWRLCCSGAVYFGAGALVACGYWFLRNWGLTGNPFFPYLGSLFGEANRPPTDFYTFGFGWTWFHYVSLFFNMFLSPNCFGAFTTRIGIFYFLTVPFILAGLFFSFRGRAYAIFWLVFTGTLFFIAQADRWMLPVLPVMAVAGGTGVQWFYRRSSDSLKKILKFGGGAAALLILSVYVLAGVYHYRYSYWLFLGKWSPDQYLTSLERTTEIAKWIDRNLPPDAKILIESEPRVFYFDRPLVKQVFLEWRIKSPQAFTVPEASLRMLQEHGIRYVVSTDLIRDGRVVAEAPSLGAKLFTAGRVRLLYSAESKNIREDRFLYRLYELK
jgi:hypothetical protein